MLRLVARQGEENGFGMPCLLIGAKNDLPASDPTANAMFLICQDTEIHAPILVSVKERQLNDLFPRIIYAARHPHLNVPETDRSRNRKRYSQFVADTLLCVSVGAAATFIGLAAYHTYAARSNTSS